MPGHASRNFTDTNNTNGGQRPHRANGVLPTSMRISGGADAPGRARGLTSHHLAGVDRGIASDAELIVSELVTNSVRHAGVGSDRMVTVGLALLDRYLRITVTDPGSHLEPRRLAATADGLGGHGLRLVEQLSAAWGVGRDAVGATQVWCDLVLDPGRGRGL